MKDEEAVRNLAPLKKWYEDNRANRAKFTLSKKIEELEKKIEKYQKKLDREDDDDFKADLKEKIDGFVKKVKSRRLKFIKDYNITVDEYLKRGTPLKRMDSYIEKESNNIKERTVTLNKVIRASSSSKKELTVVDSSAESGEESGEEEKSESGSDNSDINDDDNDDDDDDEQLITPPKKKQRKHGSRKHGSSSSSSSSSKKSKKKRKKQLHENI
jgi:hypothetical protein